LIFCQIVQLDWTEGDVNLLKNDEYWDPHAIAGLLKQFLRDLPATILTRELQQRFLSVVGMAYLPKMMVSSDDCIDLMDLNERVHELAHLVSQLPVANYSLLRAMTAHLILIVQNSSINKMTMRNVGIVFSPTLGIPAGILSLMLGEFDLVFNVDAGDESSDAASSNDNDSYIAPQGERTPQKALSPDPSTRRPSNQGYGINKRNSMLYNNTATDQMLGLVGRKLDRKCSSVGPCLY
jgi:RalA-binding protein 1